MIGSGVRARSTDAKSSHQLRPLRRSTSGITIRTNDRLIPNLTRPRQGQDIFADGDPYLDDPTLADLFAFLLESNEARQAVTTGHELRDLIMRPVDTEQIKTEIDQLVGERQRLEQEQRELEDESDDLPETPVGDMSELDAEIRRLRQQKQQLVADVNELQSVIGFNGEMLDEGASGTFAELTESDTENPTDQLV